MKIKEIRKILIVILTLVITRCYIPSVYAEDEIDNSYSLVKTNEEITNSLVNEKDNALYYEKAGWIDFDGEKRLYVNKTNFSEDMIYLLNLSSNRPEIDKSITDKMTIKGITAYTYCYGYYTESNIENIKKLTLPDAYFTNTDIPNTERFTSLKGIGFLTNLESLSIINKQASNASKLAITDWSPLLRVKGTLSSLSIQGWSTNDVASINNPDVGNLDQVLVQLTNLTNLKIDRVSLGPKDGKLDLTNLTKLETFYTRDATYNNIDVTKNTKLTTLNIEETELKTLDLSTNKHLTTLGLSCYLFNTIDLSNNTQLKHISMTQPVNVDIDDYYLIRNSKGLISIDVSNLENLETLEVQNNALTSLDLSSSKLSKLKVVKAYGNYLTTIDLTGLNFEDGYLNINIDSQANDEEDYFGQLPLSDKTVTYYDGDNLIKTKTINLRWNGWYLDKALTTPLGTVRTDDCDGVKNSTSNSMLWQKSKYYASYYKPINTNKYQADDYSKNNRNLKDFKGWYLDKELSIPYTDNIFPTFTISDLIVQNSLVGDNLKLYGDWEEEKYHVTYQYQSDSGTLPSEISTKSGKFMIFDPSLYQINSKVNRIDTVPVGTTYDVKKDGIKIGTWMLVSWDKNNDNMSKNGITFTGTWTYKSNLPNLNESNKIDKHSTITSNNKSLKQKGGSAFASYAIQTGDETLIYTYFLLCLVALLGLIAVIKIKYDK
ncbi:MAG: SHIRT domain-containing protein [Thomasclavelia sp.]|nr:SHIRT domain-containing protein [Thomasclavelia sp.]